jgi:hypothetical protein
MMISIRVPSAEPAHEAFADLTHAWLDELKADFLRSTGEALEGGSGVLMASDVLVELHGREACWARFDVDTFERWVRTNLPAFTVALPSMLADLACFTNYLARAGRIDPDRAIATQRRMFELNGLADPTPNVSPRPPPRAPGQRAPGAPARRLDAAGRIAAMQRSWRR